MLPLSRMLRRLRRSVTTRVSSRPSVELLEHRLMPSTLTILTDGDARVEKGNANRNYGSSSQLVSDRSPERETLIQFDVSGVSGTVQSAKMRVYVTDGSPNGPAVYPTDTAWSESSVTWNTRPARLGGALDDKAAVGTGWLEFDVTSWVAGNGKASFALASSSADGVYMYARERAGYAPQLIVTTSNQSVPLSADAGPDRSATENVPVSFAGSAQGGSGALFYTWDFGDGQTASNTISPAHAYSQAGVYTVRFSVRDAEGALATDTTLVTVSASSGIGQSWSSPRKVGTLDTSLVDESSGLAISRAFPGRMYHINDSGDGGYFYVSDSQGQNAQRVRVNGFSPSDAEDMAYGNYGGKNYLMIGDIGDNAESRKTLTLVVIEEQAVFGDTVNPTFKIAMQYPDGPHNAEAMALHPNGDLYIMTKENPSRVYRLTSAQWHDTSGRTQTLQLVGQFGLASQTGSSNITAMDFSPDGRRLLILTYAGALELETRLTAGVMDFSQYGKAGGPVYKVIKLTRLPQQESISYLPNGRDFVYTSEYSGSSVPILEVDRLQ